MNVADYLGAKGKTIYWLSKETGIAYTTLHPHVAHGKELGLETAKKLEEWSDGEMSAIEILGLEQPKRPSKKRAG